MEKDFKPNSQLCFIDTCIISDLFDNQGLYKAFIDFAITNRLIIGISIHTLDELKKSPKKYDRFKEEITAMPSFLIKPSEMILEDEIKSYPKQNTESLSLIRLYDNKSFLEYLDNSEKYQKSLLLINNIKPYILESILSLRDNFLPGRGNGFSNKRIIEFVEKVIFQQLTKTHLKWFQTVTNLEPVFNFEVFKTFTSQLLITFWKFYMSRERKPRKSDIYDIAFTSCFGYMNYVITEKNIANDMKQIKGKGLFFDNVIPLTITDLKNICA